jgi:hypothetical protein
MEIIPFDPAEIVEIKVGDLSAPVAVGIELSKLYLSANEIVKRLIQDIKVDKETGETRVPFDLLPWFKEQRLLLTEIYKLTGATEEKVHIKKMELQTEVFKQLIKDLPQDKKITLINALRNPDATSGNPEGT